MIFDSLYEINFSWIVFVGGMNLSPIRYCPLWKWRWVLVLKVLLNPTSGRDASHPCLISLELKEGCITTTPPFCGRNESFPNQVLSSSRMALSLSPQDFAQSHIGNVVVVYSSLGQRLIRHEWEVSLPNMGLSKTLKTRA